MVCALTDNNTLCWRSAPVHTHARARTRAARPVTCACIRAHGELMSGARSWSLLLSLRFQEVSEVISCCLLLLLYIMVVRSWYAWIVDLQSGSMSTRHSPNFALLAAVCAHVVSVLTVCCAGSLLPRGKRDFTTLQDFLCALTSFTWLRVAVSQNLARCLHRPMGLLVITAHYKIPDIMAVDSYNNFHC